MALAAKPWVCMTRETTQINRLVSGFDLAPWESKSDMVTNWRNFQKLMATPEKAILACFLAWNQSKTPKNFRSTLKISCTTYVQALDTLRDLF